MPSTQQFKELYKLLAIVLFAVVRKRPQILQGPSTVPAS